MIIVKLLKPIYSSFENSKFKIYFTGQLFFEGHFINNAKVLAEEFQNKNQSKSNINFTDYLKDTFLNKANGNFSVIIIDNDKAFVAVDIIRSQPLFILDNSEGTITVTDMLGQINENLIIDDNSLEVFAACGMVLGKNTVFKNVIGLQAGELLKIAENNISSERYFKFIPDDKEKGIENLIKFAESMDHILLSVFKRMINQNPNVHNWIVPLSGGHDSRLTINYLYRLGIRNVICFSYGIKNNEQSLISKRVAEALDYEWYFVEYTDQKWQDLHNNGLIEEYLNFAFNGVSTPHLQDFLAIYELMKKGIIEGNDIVMKSHGDFIAGNHLKDIDLTLSKSEDAIDRVITQHTKIKDKSTFAYGVIKEIYEGYEDSPEFFQEYFNWQERQAKLMINSLRVYEFFGLESRIPFWDRENVNFWLSTHSDQRVRRNMFLKSERQGLLVESLLQIPYAGENKIYSKASMIDKLRNLLPSLLINRLLQITGKRVKLNEGLNQIYALKAKSVKELLDPIEDFPAQIMPYFRDYLHRFPYQVNSSTLTTLHTIRKLLDRYKKQEETIKKQKI